MFEEQQDLKFDVYDIDNDSQDLSQHDFLGSCTVTLDQVVSAGSVVLDLLHPKDSKGNYGNLIVSSVPVQKEKSDHVNKVEYGLLQNKESGSAQIEEASGSLQSSIHDGKSQNGTEAQSKSVSKDNVNGYNQEETGSA